MSDVLEFARSYAARGWRVIPLPARSKKPTAEGWSHWHLLEDELPQFFSNGSNIGVLLGEPSGGLVDVDLDSPEAVRLAPHFLPPTLAVFGRASKRRSHWLYNAAGAETKKFQIVHGSERATILELRSTGTQTVFPGSTHPQGEAIEWAETGAPLLIAADELLGCVSKLAAAALLVSVWPQNARHDASLALAGGLLRDGWMVNEAASFVGIVAEGAHDEDVEDRVRAVRDTAARLARQGKATGWTTLTELLGEHVLNRVRDWLDLPLSGAADVMTEVPAAAPADGVRVIGADEVRMRRVEYLPGQAPRLPLGMVTLLTGEPGLGKTQEMVRVAGAHPGVTIFLTAEDNLESVLVPRLRLAGADLSLVKFLVMRRDGVDGGLTLPDDIGELDRAVGEAGATLVCIDPVVAHISAAVDSHRDHDVRRVLAPLHRMAEQRRCAVLGTLHLNKKDSASIVSRISASIGFQGAARSIMLLARDPEDPEGERGVMRVLAHVKCNYAPLAVSLSMRVEGGTVASDDAERIETSRIVVVGESLLQASDLLVSTDAVGDDREQRPARDAAVDFLRQELAEGRRPAGDLLRSAARLGISGRTIDRAKRELRVVAEREGYGSDGTWYWTLP